MSSPAVITSSANPLVKRARRLRSRKHREAEASCLVEGIHPVWQAVQSGVPVEALLATPEALATEHGAALAAQAKERGTRITVVAEQVLATISDRDDPPGVAAIVNPRFRELAELEIDAGSLVVALHETGNPGNLGTIARTVDAVAGAGVVLVGRTTDPWSPAAVKASMGTVFRVALARCRQLDEALTWARHRDLRVIATSAHASVDVWSAQCELPALVLLGNEGNGLPAEAITSSDIAVRIPMEGSASSLNLAVAAGVVLYELKRRRAT